MTTETLRRCGTCGRHKAGDGFKSTRAKVCLACEARAMQAQHAKRPARRRTGSRKRGAAKASLRKAPTPELQARLDDGSAVWHECDGAGVHPAHVDVHREGFWTEGHRVIAFIEGYCVFPADERMGEPAELMPWWREVIVELYRLRDDGVRQYRRAYISVAKKNAKTTVLGWIALYHTVADTREASPKVVCAAANDDQADLVFQASKDTAAEQSKGARDVAATGLSLYSLTERWTDEILVPSRPGASLRRVASGGGNLDGPNLYVRVIDELHEWRTNKNLDTYRVLSQGGTQRRQPLFIQITTAGWDQESLCYRVYEHAKKVEDEPTLDPYLFSAIFEAPADCELTEENWLLANPGAGHAVLWERFLEDYDDPEMTEAVARRYRFNQWTDTEEAWLPTHDGKVRPWSSWAMAEPVPVCRPTDVESGLVRVIAGIDAATKRDSTVITWWEVSGPRDEPRVRSWSRVWDRPTLQDGSPDESWRLPQQEVKAHLYSLHKGTKAADEFWCDGGHCICCGLQTEPLRLLEVGFDPSRITMQTDVWTTDGLPMVEVYQSDARMVPGFQTFYELLDADRYEHDGNPAIEQHIRNSVVKWASNGGRRIDRKHASTQDRRPNDGAITQVINGYTLTSIPEPKRRSVYETRGVVQVGDET